MFGKFGVLALMGVVLLLLAGGSPVVAQGGDLFVDSGQVIGGDTGSSVALADLDGDGDLDLFAANLGPNRIWFNQGGVQGGSAGVFLVDPGQNLGAGISRHVALGDLDGDGDPDAFLANMPGLPNQVWFNGEQGNPAGVFSDSGQAIDNVNSADVVLADLNGDGDLDAFVATGDGGVRSWANLIWLNGGDGYGQVTGQCLGDSESRALALGDLDGDGDPDAFLANIGPDIVWLNGPGEECSCMTAWLLNETGQAAARASAQSGLNDALATFYALRDQLLAQTRRGRHYTRVYDQHNAEVFSALLADSALRDEAVTLLQAWQPNLQLLVDGQGQNAIITPGQVQLLRNFLNHLGAAASPELQQTISFELAQLPPLGQFAGMTMDDAQHVVLKIAYRYLPVMPNR